MLISWKTVRTTFLCIVVLQSRDDILLTCEFYVANFSECNIHDMSFKNNSVKKLTLNALKALKALNFEEY